MMSWQLEQGSECDPPQEAIFRISPVLWKVNLTLASIELQSRLHCVRRWLLGHQAMTRPAASVCPWLGPCYLTDLADSTPECRKPWHACGNASS